MQGANGAFALWENNTTKHLHSIINKKSYEANIHFLNCHNKNANFDYYARGKLNYLFILTLGNIIIPLSYKGTIKRYVVMSIIS